MPPEDPDQLAAKILEVVSDEERRKAVGAASAERVKSDYSLNAMVSRTARLYRHVIDSRRAIPRPAGAGAGAASGGIH